MFIRWAVTSLKYAFGVLCWMVLLGLLMQWDVFNAGSFVDGLWVKNLHDNLVQNVIGEVAYRATSGYGDYGSGPKYIYLIEYHASRKGAKEEVRSLGSLVDVATWKWVRSEGSTHEIYMDAKHKYIVRTISDGADISVVDR